MAPALPYHINSGISGSGQKETLNSDGGSGSIIEIVTLGALVTTGKARERSGILVAMLQMVGKTWYYSSMNQSKPNLVKFDKTIIKKIPYFQFRCINKTHR